MKVIACRKGWNFQELESRITLVIFEMTTGRVPQLCAVLPAICIKKQQCKLNIKMTEKMEGSTKLASYQNSGR